MQRWLIVALVLATVMAIPAHLCAQEPIAAPASSDVGPRFLMATPRETLILDVSRTPVLRRRVSVDVQGVPLRTVLDLIANQAGLSLSFSPDIVNLDAPVTLEAKNLTVAAALTEVLIGLRVDVVLSPSGQLSVVKKPKQPAVGTVSGRVTDSTSHAGIPATTVSVEGTRLSTTTNQEGDYLIRGIGAGTQSIKARRLGYAVQTRSITVLDNANATLDFALPRTPTTLEEMVVTATGDRRRLEVGNAIGSIKADSIVPTTLIRNMSDLLQARSPGVIVSNNSGNVGAPSIVRLRGVSSMTLSNDPIIILDGVRLAPASNAGLGTKIGNVNVVQAPSAAQTSGTNGRLTSRLDDIDPNTIESIDILRGPSASSLYGTDAANGVIVIKTKQGSNGSFRFDILGDEGRSHVPASQLPRQTVAYGHDADGTPDLNCRWYFQLDHGCVQDSARVYDPLNASRLSSFGTGTARHLNASLSGGTDRLREFLSLTGSAATGVVRLSAVESDRLSRMWGSPVPSWITHPNSESDANATSRTNLHVGHNLDLSLTVAGIYRNTLAGGDGSLLSVGANQAGVPTSTARFFAGDTLINLPAEQQRAMLATVVKRGAVSASANYMPLPWLLLRATLGGDFTLRDDESLLRATDCTTLLNPAGCRSGRAFTNGELFVTTVDLGAQASWTPTSFLSLRTIVGEQINRTLFHGVGTASGSQTNLAFGTTVLSPPPVTTVSGVQQYTVTENRDESAVAGWYVEETAALGERLFLTAGFRQDLASGFGTRVNASNAPLYPKLGLSWLLSSEPFFPRLPGVSSFRVRASVGRSGQEARQQAVQNNFTASTAIVDGALVPGIGLSAFGNPDLRPERTSEVEGGFDLSLLQSERIHLEVTTYRKLTIDELATASLAPTAGAVSYTVNLGSVENRGVEASASLRLLDMPSASWDLIINATRNTNRLVSAIPAIANNAPFLGAGSDAVGYPLQSFFGRRITGYGDFNNDGVLSLNEIQFGPDLIFLGSANPEAEFTYGNSFRFFGGNLGINANFDQVNGKSLTSFRDITLGGNLMPAFFSPGSIQQQAMLLQGIFGTGAAQATFANKANTLRFSELSVSVTVPPTIAARVVHSRSARVTLAGRNLAVWTTSPLKDNNFSGSQTNVVSIATLGLPQPREWTLRFNLGF